LRLAYHHPCHLRLQPHADASITMLEAMDGIQVNDLKSHCCGMAGSWGMLAKNITLSKTIGAPMAQLLNASDADYGITDCPTCQMQMEHLGRLPVRHPVEIIWKAMRDRDRWRSSD
jgi:Fe-S oxidoreductase